MSKPITSFDDIIGHKNIIAYIQKVISIDRVPNFIIMHGNPGVGKTATAKLLACHVASNFKDDVRAKNIDEVILKNKSTDSIKLFNMSNLKDNSEVAQVKAEMAVGFSTTGRKVIILDEAHGMTNEAQDAILTSIEALPDNVYVFLCTTELGALRDALQSRAKAVWAFNPLTELEAQRLIQNTIRHHGLKFESSVDFVVRVISAYCQNEPRRALNLLESFPENSVVSNRDIEAFIPLHDVSVVLQLMKYLYGSMVLGISYLQDMRVDQMAVHAMVEVLKCALGYESKEVNPEQSRFIREFFSGNDVKNYMRFVARVSGLSSLVRRRVISIFIEEHIDYTNILNKPERVDESVQDARNFKNVSDNISIPETSSESLGLHVQSLSELMSMTERME